MKKLKLFFLSLILILSFSTGVSAEYFSDIIVTSSDGIWTDSRAYSTLNDAVTAVGANQRTIVIASPQTVTALTVPSNVTLKFERDGSIVNSGQLTINTKNIISDGHKIFAGLGDIDFASGTVVKLSWFHNLWNALTMTSDDHVTMVIDKAINATASVAVGNDVTLRWEAPNIISANAGVTVSNIGQIESGSYQIMAGAGNFRFRDGVSLNLEWFPYLRMALTWIDTTDATIVVNESSDVDYSDSVPLNIQLKINNGGALDIAPGVTLTLADTKQIDIGPYYFDPFTGTGSVAITGGATYTPATGLTGLILNQLVTYTLPKTIPYEVDALYDYGDGTDYTNATLMAACTAVGADVATILIRPGTWIQSANVDYIAVCPNAVFKFAPGAIISHGTNTLNIPNINAELYQIFSGDGAVTLSGKIKEVYPEWYGAKDDSGTTDNYTPISRALATGRLIRVTAPNGGYYKITDVLSVAVAGTKIVSDNKAEIVQATSNKGGFEVTASNVEFRGLKITGPQYATSQAGEKAIYPYGADSSNYITGLKVIDCEISNWGRYGIYPEFLSDFEFSRNRIYNIFYGGIICLSCIRGNITDNDVYNITGEIYGNAYGIELSRWANDSLVTNPRSGYINVSDNRVSNIPSWRAYGTHGGEHITFNNNRSYGTYMGIGVGGATDGDGDVTFAPLNITVTNNILDSGLSDGSASYGIFFTGAIANESATGIVSNNVVSNFGNEVNGCALYFHTTNSVVVSNNSVLAPGRHGADLSTNNFGMLFTNNIIYDTWSNTFVAPAGVYIIGANTAVLEGNYFIKGTKVATYDFSSAAAVGIVIRDEADSYPRIGKNYIKDVTNYILDSGGRSGRLSIAQPSTSGTGEDDLATLTIPAGTIGRYGGFKVSAAGIKKGTGGNKTLKFYFGTLAITFHAAANDTNNWTFEATVINTSSTGVQTIKWLGTNGATVLSGYSAGAIDTTVDVTVKITGECADIGDTITQRIMLIERL